MHRCRLINPSTAALLQFFCVEYVYLFVSECVCVCVSLCVCMSVCVEYNRMYVCVSVCGTEPMYDHSSFFLRNMCAIISVCWSM